ncbi:MAG: hypothetical protein LBI18_15855 [Planctomycetaceae bacterium]|jgi:hypothetical protein|nr:hypothetical protein [Planctomycetaceae bacterium]
MSTFIEPSRVSRIQDELKTLSRQELRLVEITARELQQNLDVSENKDNDNNFDFGEDGWLRPKPEHILDFMETWRGCLEDLPDWDKKPIREMRLNERYGE